MDNKKFIDASVGSKTIMLADMGTTPTMPLRDERFTPSDEIEYWGYDNLEPFRLLKEIGSNSVLTNDLWFVTRALYAGGLEYGYSDGEEFVRTKLPDMDAILRASNIPVQMVRGISGYKMLANSFPEFILSKDRSKIVRFSYLNSADCRWSKAKANIGYQYCYADANWDLNFGRLEKNTAVKIDAITADGYGAEADWMREQNGYKYVMPGVRLPVMDRHNYSLPPWASIIETKWLSYTNQIPKFKEAYLKNASHIKYVIHVPLSWWLWKYPDWESKTAKEQLEIRTLEHDRFDKFLAGVDNAGKSLLLTYRDDPAFQQQGYTQWKIETLDKKVIDGILKDDVLETSQMIHTAVGVDGSLVGNSPGSKLGAGSGSDKREAFNIFMALSTADQDILLRPLEVMAEYNGYPELKFRFNNRFLELLSSITPSQRNTQDAND
jgi:hypothetical protein